MEPHPALLLDEFGTYISSRRTLPRYDSTTEKKPEQAWWSLDKAAIDALLKALSQLLSDLLKGSPDSDK